MRDSNKGYISRRNLTMAPLRAAEYDARCAAPGAIDPDLHGLNRAWPNLSESVRKEILKHLPSPSTRQQRQT